MCFELFTFGELTSYPLSFCAIQAFEAKVPFFLYFLIIIIKKKKKSYLSPDIGFMSCWLYVLMKKTSICFSVLEIYVRTYLGLMEDIASYLITPF